MFLVVIVLQIKWKREFDCHTRLILYMTIFIRNRCALQKMKMMSFYLYLLATISILDNPQVATIITQ